VRRDQPEGIASSPFPTGVCRASPVRRPVVSSRANARGAAPARQAARISRLLARSSVVTTRYFRERISLSYREHSSQRERLLAVKAELAHAARSRCVLGTQAGDRAHRRRYGR
jgi:hypothetical protein